MATSDLPGNINQAKKRPLIGSFSDNQSPSAAAGTRIVPTANPIGVMTTPEQQSVQRRAGQVQAAQSRIASDRDAVIDGARGATNSLLDYATAGPARRLMAGMTFDSRLPRQDVRDRQRAESAGAQMRDNPGAAEAADQFAHDLSSRTLTAGLHPPAPAPASANQANPAMTPYAGPAQSQPRSPALQEPMLRTGQAEAQPERTFPDAARANDWGNLGRDGIVGRRNEQGIQEFSNMPSDQDAASGRQASIASSRIGNGIGGLSIAGGAAEAMERNTRATEIMQQGRLERQNPNYVTTVHNSGASGMQGIVNRTLNRNDDATRAERTRAHQGRVDAGRNRLADMDSARADRGMVSQQMERQEQRNRLGDDLTRQQIAQGSRAAESDQRMQALQARMSDPNATPEERREATIAYLSMTVPSKDRYRVQDGVIAESEYDGPPITGRQLVDVVTGQPIAAGIQPSQQQSKIVTEEQVREKAKADGRSFNEARRLVVDAGYEVRG